MNLDNLTKEKVIKYHLSLKTKLDENVDVFSSLVALLRDCRELTGRNTETGKRNHSHDKDKSDNWLGAIGYLTVLDQIGKCYRLTKKEQITNNSIIKALKYFSDLDEDEIFAIYALRCSFAHDYSLFNINTNKKGFTHHFTVTGHGYHRIINLPSKPWDGDFGNRKVDNMTVINIPLLTDLIEDIINKLKSFIHSGELELEISPQEIKDRYLLFYNHNNNDR